MKNTERYCKNNTKYQCPCCEFYTLSEKDRWSYEICPVCWWEDDDLQLADIDLEGWANTPSLRQARINYATFWAVDKHSLSDVRPPYEDEKLF